MVIVEKLYNLDGKTRILSIIISEIQKNPLVECILLQTKKSKIGLDDELSLNIVINRNPNYIRSVAGMDYFDKMNSSPNQENLSSSIENIMNDIEKYHKQETIIYNTVLSSLEKELRMQVGRINEQKTDLTIAITSKYVFETGESEDNIISSYPILDRYNRIKLIDVSKVKAKKLGKCC